LEPHEDTFVPILAPEINDDETTHPDHGSYLSSEYYLEDDENGVDQHADVEPPHMPKW
jgi:hypothetical protein